MFIYPENLKAKPMLWLWELRDIGIIGVGFLLSVLALSQGAGMIPLVITVLWSRKGTARITRKPPIWKSELCGNG